MTRAAATPRKDKVGEVLYNRGVINAIYDLEAIRTAQGKFGKKPLKGEEVRWGYEHLDITPQRIAELGADGLMVPMQLSCADHEGNGKVRIQQWDGKHWKFVSDWIQPDRDDADRDVQGIGAHLRARRRASRRATAPKASDEVTREGPAVGSAPRRGATSGALLAVNNIEVIYNHVILVLKGVSLEVPEGGIVALLGGQRRRQDDDVEGDLQPAARRARRGDQGLDRLRRRARRRARRRTTRQARRHPGDGGPPLLRPSDRRGKSARPAPSRGATAAARCARDLDKVYGYFPRLQERRQSLAGYTSGGEQQMTAIGRALMAQPKMILLDEPSHGPGAAARRGDLRDRRPPQRARARSSFLLAEQNTNIALRYADYGYILENGRIVMDGAGGGCAPTRTSRNSISASPASGRKSYRDVKHYRRRKRWLA